MGFKLHWPGTLNNSHWRLSRSTPNRENTVFKRSQLGTKVGAIACIALVAQIFDPVSKPALAQKFNCDAVVGSVRCRSEAIKLSPNGVPPRAAPGWSLWFEDAQREAADFDAGFSNLELGGYMEFEAFCQQQTGLKPDEVEYWFRLNNSLQQIGTGQVEFGCWRNQKFVHRFASTAVRRSLNTVTCLLVDSPVGNGLVVRSQPGFNSQRLGVVANNTKVEPVSYPALIVNENNRDWLKITAPIAGWISNGAATSHGNLRLCG
jgi:hypothetical protein